MFLGLHTTTIEYDTEKMVWELVEHYQNVTATANAPLASYVLGTHEWLIQNDKRECFNKIQSHDRILKRTGCKEDEDTCTGGQCINECNNIVESYRTVLKLTGCREGEFTCSDGQCIRYSRSSNILYIMLPYTHRMEERCDQIMDCVDESDEDHCRLIAFKDNYNKKVPPFTISKKSNSLVPARIKISTQLKNVLAISEFSHTIDLKIGITLKWYENRVLYHNLKNQEALNVLNNAEVLKITGCLPAICKSETEK